MSAITTFAFLTPKEWSSLCYSPVLREASDWAFKAHFLATKKREYIKVSLGPKFDFSAQKVNELVKGLKLPADVSLRVEQIDKEAKCALLKFHSDTKSRYTEILSQARQYSEVEADHYDDYSTWDPRYGVYHPPKIESGIGGTAAAKKSPEEVSKPRD
jgi:hypothetical protein